MTDLRQHFFSDKIVNKWNTLSEEMVSASSLNNFKGKLQRLHNDGWETDISLTNQLADSQLADKTTR